MTHSAVTNSETVTAVANTAVTTAVTFDQLQLDARLLKAIHDLGFTKPTDVQRDAIPLGLAGHDLMVSAQTGTGKTAAFMLPALHRLLTTPGNPGRGPRVLVLTPTRELAQQVTDAVRDFGKDTRLRCGVIVGGVPYLQQERLLKNPCDILVATPGRLMDHMDRGRVDFSRLEMLILDEADRMLDMGFVDDVKAIAEKMPKERQTLLFSATLEGEIEVIARQLLKNPQRVQVSSVKEKHESITQFVLAADNYQHKLALIENMLADGGVHQAIVFVGTKMGTEELADTLKANGHFAHALHGDMRQNVRNRVIERAHEGKLRVLVATDVAARGLDVKGLTHVINFDLPMVAEDYVHRIGRTGRGGKTGTAMSLVSPREWHKWERIERLTGTTVDEVMLEGLEPRTSRPVRGKSRPGTGARPQRDGRSSGRSFGDGPRRGRTEHSRPEGGRSFGGGTENRGERGGYAGRSERPEGRSFDNRGEGRSFEPRAPRADYSNSHANSSAGAERGGYAGRSEGRSFDRDAQPRSFDRDAQPRSYEGRTENRGERSFAPRSEVRRPDGVSVDVRSAERPARTSEYRSESRFGDSRRSNTDSRPAPRREGGYASRDGNRDEPRTDSRPPRRSFSN